MVNRNITIFPGNITIFNRNIPILNRKYIFNPGPPFSIAMLDYRSVIFFHTFFLLQWYLTTRILVKRKEKNWKTHGPNPFDNSGESLCLGAG